jgi:tetratricopeptide (TPR) repeat protein
MTSVLKATLFALICVSCSATSVVVKGITEQSNSLDRVIATTPEYDLAITLLPDSHRMEVTGMLRVPPRHEAQETIELGLSELMKDFHVEIVEPAESAGPVTLTTGEKKNPQDKFVRWMLRPKQPIVANKSVRMHFTYQGGESVAFVFYIGPEGSFAGGSDTAWYPQLNENDGRGRGRLKFSVPRGYTVLATGNSQGIRSKEMDGNFEFENKVPSKFSFAAAKYTVLKRDGIVPMRAYLLHPRANVEGYFDGSSKVLAVLSKEFGKYPYDEFSIAEVPSEQAGKAGFSGASLNGFMLANKEALDDPFNLAYYGHEIGHQWWGNVVSHSGDRGDYMLDEAMAQFGSLRVVETVDGTVAGEEYRRTGYPGYVGTQCGYEYLRSAESGQDHPLAELPKDPNSHELANSKGFLIWDLLSQTVGPQRFSQTLQDITKRYAFQTIRWEEFLIAVQTDAGKDLSWFYSQWFERTGAPVWQVTWKQDEQGVHGEITQTAPFYRAKLEVETQGANGETILRNVDVAGERTEFAWPVSFRIRSVVLDPHFRVLHWLPDLRAAALARAPVFHAASLRNAGKLDEAESLLRKAIENISQPDEHGARFLDEFGLARISMERKNWRDAQSHLDSALEAPSRDKSFLPWVYYFYAMVAQSLNDDVKLHWAVQATLEADALVPGGTTAPQFARALLKPKDQ